MIGWECLCLAKLSASPLSFGWDQTSLLCTMFICKCLRLNYSRHLEQQIGIFSAIYCVKNVLLYCNKCMQQLLLLFVPAFNYLGDWVGVMVMVVCWQGKGLSVPMSVPMLKLFWNERIKHTFLCWNVFTKHHSLPNLRKAEWNSGWFMILLHYLQELCQAAHAHCGGDTLGTCR